MTRRRMGAPASCPRRLGRNAQASTRDACATRHHPPTRCHRRHQRPQHRHLRRHPQHPPPPATRRQNAPRPRFTARLPHPPRHAIAFASDVRSSCRQTLKTLKTKCPCSTQKQKLSSNNASSTKRKREPGGDNTTEKCFWSDFRPGVAALPCMPSFAVMRFTAVRCAE